MSILREPVEVGRLRCAWYRPRVVRMWLWLTGISLVCAAGLLRWLLSPQEADLRWLAGMMVVAPLAAFGVLPAVHYLREEWTWDEQGWWRGPVLHRWGKFQRFRVRPDPQAPGFVRLAIQFGSRFWGRGAWIAITAEPREIEALAEAVR